MEDISALDVKDFKTTFYFIISCDISMFFSKRSVKISPSGSANLIGREIIRVKEIRQQYMPVKELNNSLKNKNVYIYKLIISSKKEIEDIFINLEINNDKLISKSSFKINRTSLYRFIYSLKFEGDGFINYKLFRESLSNKFVNNTFNVSNFQKFLIFKEYINNHEKKDLIEYLLEDTAKEIKENQSSIDYEMILFFFINLLNFQNEYSNIDKRRQSIFELAISNFIEKEISIKKYNNNEYGKIITTIEKYRNDLNDKNLLLNLDIIILLYYQFHDKKKFMSFLGTIKSKEEAIDYMLKYPNIFSKYDCSELEIMFKYGKKDFQKL